MGVTIEQIFKVMSLFKKGGGTQMQVGKLALPNIRDVEQDEDEVEVEDEAEAVAGCSKYWPSDMELASRPATAGRFKRSTMSRLEKGIEAGGELDRRARHGEGRRRYEMSRLTLKRALTLT